MTGPAQSLSLAMEMRVRTHAIGGGLMNDIDGNYGAVGGGSANKLSGDYGAIGGGDSNQMSGALGAIACEGAELSCGAGTT